MQIVIDIPEEFYEWTKEYWENHPDPKVHSEIDLATLAISRGIILPEKYGVLVDRNEVSEKMRYYGFHTVDMTVHEFVEDELTTVLEATEEQE